MSQSDSCENLNNGQIFPSSGNVSNCSEQVIQSQMRNNLRQVDGERRIRLLNDSSVFGKLMITWDIGKQSKICCCEKVSLVLPADSCLQSQNEKYDFNLTFQRFLILEAAVLQFVTFSVLVGDNIQKYI